jgi:hypothetical protein
MMAPIKIRIAPGPSMVNEKGIPKVISFFRQGMFLSS